MSLPTTGIDTKTRQAAPRFGVDARTGGSFLIWTLAAAGFGDFAARAASRRDQGSRAGQA
jgi:hypothetical protein